MRDPDKLDVSRPIADRVDADVIETDGHSYLVSYPDGGMSMEPATALNTALFSLDRDTLESVDYMLTFDGLAQTDTGMDTTCDAADQREITVAETTERMLVSTDGETTTEQETTTTTESATEALGGVDVTLQIDVLEGEYRVAVNDEAVQLLPDEYSQLSETLFETVQADTDESLSMPIPLDAEQAQDIYQTYRQVIATRVRMERIGPFIDALFGPAVEIEDRSVVVADAVVVNEDGSNYLVEQKDAFNATGGSISRLDDSHQLIKLEIPSDPEAVFTLDGTDHVLSSSEQEFLVTLLAITRPKEYLGVDKFEGRAVSAVRNATEQVTAPGLDSLAREATVTGWMDPVTGLVHAHALDKHVLSSSFSLSPWVVDSFKFSDFDHAGVHELAHLEPALRDADRDVFFDVENDDDTRWEQINETTSAAKVPDFVTAELDQLYGSNPSL